MTIVNYASSGANKLTASLNDNTNSSHLRSSYVYSTGYWRFDHYGSSDLNQKVIQIFNNSSKLADFNIVAVTIIGDLNKIGRLTLKLQS